MTQILQLVQHNRNSKDLGKKQCTREIVSSFECHDKTLYIDMCTVHAKSAKAEQQIGLPRKRIGMNVNVMWRNKAKKLNQFIQFQQCDVVYISEMYDSNECRKSVE